MTRASGVRGKIQKNWIFTTVICLFSAQGLMAEMDLPKLAAQVRPSVGLVVVYDSSGAEIATGSGFFITPQEFVTNNHVVDGATSVKIKMEGGAVYDSVGVLASDDKKDIAILFINSKAVPLPLSKTSSIDPGTHIAVIGSPLGLEGTVSDGIVSGVRLTSNGTLLQITAPISHGSSGSPVLNEKGEVIGVASSNLEGGQALNFAISSSVVQGMVDTITSKTLFAKYPNAKADQSAQLLHDPIYQKALNLMDNEQYDEALQILKQLLDTYPKAAEVYFQIGYIFDHAKMWNESIDAYNQATILNPDLPGIWEQFGRTLTRAGKPKEAIVALKHGLAIKSAPNIISLWDALGCAYGNSSDYKSEVSAFSEAVRLATTPNATGNLPAADLDRLYALLATSYFSLGQQQDGAGQYADAIQSYKDSNAVWQTAKQLFPQWPQPITGVAENYTGMALTLQKTGDNATGENLINTALSVAPMDSVVLWNSGKFYYLAGRNDRYQAVLNSLTMLDPSTASKLDSFLRSH